MGLQVRSRESRIHVRTGSLRIFRSLPFIHIHGVPPFVGIAGQRPYLHSQLNFFFFKDLVSVPC